MTLVGKTYIKLSLLGLSFSFHACELIQRAKRLVCLIDAPTRAYSVEFSLTESYHPCHFGHIQTCKASKFEELLVFSAASTCKFQGSCAKLPLLSPPTAQKTAVDVYLGRQETNPVFAPFCVKYKMAANLDDSGVEVNEDLSIPTSEDLTQMGRPTDPQIQDPDSHNQDLDSLFKSPFVSQEDSGLMETDLPQTAAAQTSEKHTVLPKSLLTQVTDLVKHGDVSTEGGGTTDGKAMAAKVLSKKKTMKSRKNKKDTDNKGDESTEGKASAEGGKKRKKKKKNKGDKDESKAREDNEDEPRKPQRAPPTHFISIQINNPQIHSGMAEVQKAILAVEKKMEVAMVSTATAHLTLMVMRLETDEDVKRAGDALDKCVQDNWSNYSQGSEQLGLEVCGLGHFDHNVLFAKVSPGPQLEELQKIAKSVETCLADDNVPKADPKPFKPHITLMKFSGKRGHLLRKQGIRKIDPSLYESFSDHVFGCDTVRSLQLCSMTLPKHEETGYYHIEHEVSFGLFGDGEGHLSKDSHVIVSEPSKGSAGRLDDQAVLSGDSEKTATKGDEESMSSGESEKSSIKCDNESVLSGDSERSAVKCDKKSVLTCDSEKSAFKCDDLSVLNVDSEKTASKCCDQSALNGDSEKSATNCDEESVSSGDSNKSATKGDDQDLLTDGTIHKE